MKQSLPYVSVFIIPLSEARGIQTKKKMYTMLNNNTTYKKTDQTLLTKQNNRMVNTWLKRDYFDTKKYQKINSRVINMLVVLVRNNYYL